MNDSASPVVDELSTLLASSYTLYLKTHNFHWNVTGPMFTTLHTLFETQYLDLALAVDEIAERIRARGAFAPGTFAEFAHISTIAEAEGHPKATDMIVILADDQDRVADAARKLIEVAEAAGDNVSADLAIRRVEIHEKNAWMLRSHLD
ncbi:MAG: Dps family protein [Planctomycetota bacterium]